MKENQANKPTSPSEIQLDQLARELETEEGLRRLAEDAYKEALAAEKKSITPYKSDKS